MIRRPPRSTRTDTLFPYTTLFRSVPVERILSARIAESCPDLHDFIVPLSERRKLFPAFLFAFSRSRFAFGLLQGGRSDDCGDREIAVVNGRGGARRQLTWLMWMASPTSVPVRSTITLSGMLAASQTSSSSWRTTFSTPPRLMPGDASSF